MSSKLTISLDKKTLERAEKYVKSLNLTLSEVVEKYLKSIAENNSSKNDNSTPIVDSAKGSFSLPENIDQRLDQSESDFRNNKYKKVSELKEKYED